MYGFSLIARRLWDSATRRWASATRRARSSTAGGAGEGELDGCTAGVDEVGVGTADFIAANFAAISARFWAMSASAVIWEKAN